MLSSIILMLPGPRKKPSQQTCQSQIPPLVLPPKVLGSAPGEHFLLYHSSPLSPTLSEGFRAEALDLQVSFQGQMEPHPGHLCLLES